MGHNVVSIVRKGAPLREALSNMKLAVDEVSYIRSVHPLVFEDSVKRIRKAMLPYNAKVVFVHKQIDIPLVRAALGKNTIIIGVIHGFNAKHIDDADRLIAVSKKVYQFLEQEGFKNPICVIPNMVKISSKPQYRDLPEMPLIGAMGIFRRKKGFHVLIEALRILKKRGVKFHAIIAGRGKRRWVLHYLRFKYRLKKELLFKGWISNEERDAFFDTIDIYCLPSRTESFGMVVPEAMGRMKRVVATKCGGPEEIISHGEDGYLVAKENPEAMADMLEYIIRHTPKNDTIPYAAQKKVLENYEINAVKKSLSALLGSIGI